MGQILKRILAGSIPAFMVFALSGCGSSASGSTETASAPAEEPASEPAEAPAAAETSAGKYTALGMNMGQYVVKTDSLDGNYLDLKEDGSGYLYFGEENQGDITSWEETGGTFTMKAGVSEFEGTLKDGILDLKIGDAFVIKFAGDGADTSAYKIITAEEYQKLVAKETDSKDADENIAGFYYAYAVESGGRCILLPEEDRKSFAFTVNEDGTGKIHVKDESEAMLWKLEGDVMTFYEMTGEPAVGDYDITLKDGIITIAVPPDEEGGELLYEYLVKEDTDTSQIDARAEKTGTQN